MSHTFVIAEAGSCHDNSFTKALRLIDAAKECGADACKFQFWSHPGKLAARRGLGPDAKAVYERYQLPSSWLPRLKDHCDESGVEFMVTSYLIEDIEVIAPYVKRFKVSAYESEWFEFVNAHVRLERPVVMSTYAHFLAPRKDWRWMHCVSKYPTPTEEIQVRYCTPHMGLSDHTVSPLTGALAVARGAVTVEKHFRLRDTDPACPDFGHSLVGVSSRGNCQNYCQDEPDFQEYVRNIREAERCL